MQPLSKVVTDQEDNRNVQSECDCCVQEKSDDADIVDVTHAHLWHFDKECNHTIDGSTGRCIVVERDKRVHLELRCRQDALHHDKSDSLEYDSSHLNYHQSQHILRTSSP